MAFGFGTAGTTSVGLHFFPFLSDLGLTMGAAAAAVSIQAVATLTAKLFWGVLADRYPVRHCGIVVFVLSALGMASFFFLTQVPTFWL
ncbi:MAG: hypothetical protein Q7O66_17310, partial [Dehalococcoidia bacterium]|nr:hypothetical protein [Dehalococcoidia bacterium]